MYLIKELYGAFNPILHQYRTTSFCVLMEAKSNNFQQKLDEIAFRIWK